MKIIKSLTIICFSAVLIMSVSCNHKGSKTSGASDTIAIPARIEVSIKGMSCTDCEQIIQANVAKLNGVKSVKADYTTGKAIIDYNAGLMDTAGIRTAITGTGYGVTAFTPLSLNDSIN